MKHLKRREVLKIGAGALLTAGAWPEALRAQNKDDAWSFIAVNDLHFQDEKCAPWFEKAVAAMKKSAPDADFCLLGGDLANDGKREQLQGVKTAFEALKTPLYAVPGNHDYLADDDRKAYDELFPGQLNQVFAHRGWQFIGLDTTDGTRYEKTKIQAANFRLVRCQIAATRQNQTHNYLDAFSTRRGRHLSPAKCRRVAGKIRRFQHPRRLLRPLARLQRKNMAQCRFHH